MADSLRGRISARLRQRKAPSQARRDPEPLDPLSPVLDAIGDPLLIVTGTTVTHANSAARALLGVHIVTDDVRLAIRQPAAVPLLAGGEAGSAELAGLGGHERRWLLSVTTVDAGRRLLRLTDISVQRAAERMRVDFVANASHELRTPLAALIGFIETLEEANGPADAKTRLRFLGIMGGEARRMQRLIDDLMSLSRIEADRFVLPRDPVDLSPLLRQTIAELHAAQGEQRVELIDVTGAATVAGDRAQISQLLHNIIGNALKYGRSGTTVRVRLAHEAALLRLDVADEGDGIAAEHLPRLTERFYRVDPGRSRAIGGTGLGLAIVKHIVERHRGRMEIASEVGRGTTFTVWLPPFIPSSK